MSYSLEQPTLGNFELGLEVETFLAENQRPDCRRVLLPTVALLCLDRTDLDLSAVVGDCHMLIRDLEHLEWLDAENPNGTFEHEDPIGLEFVDLASLHFCLRDDFE